MTEPGYALPAGTELEHYRIEEVLGTGAFSITYKAWDGILEQWVAIKEFLPREIAQRLPGQHTVEPCSDRPEQYHYGLNRFLDEARALARFQHPNIVRVQRFIEANGTAYLIMEWQQGLTLAELLRRQPRLPEQKLVEIIVPVLRGLIEVHKAGFLHRDIKPDNIYLREPGGPMLIDFGASREAIGKRSQDLTRILSPGYAPPEQYTTDASKQSTWTDLYALGGVMYRCVTGVKPHDSPTRREALHDGEPDPLTPVVEVGRGEYSEALLQLIDRLLEPRYQGRPASAQAVLTAIETGRPIVAVDDADGDTEIWQQDDETRLVTPLPGRAEESETRWSGGQINAEAAAVSPSQPRMALIAVPMLVLFAGGFTWYLLQGSPTNSQLGPGASVPVAESLGASRGANGGSAASEDQVAAELVAAADRLAERVTPDVSAESNPKPEDLAELEPGKLSSGEGQNAVLATPPFEDSPAVTEALKVSQETVSSAAPIAQPETQTVAPGPIFRDAMRDGGKGPELVPMPVGEFRMGNLNGGGAEDEKPVHTVTIAAPIAIMVREVSFDEYDRFAGATGSSMPDDKGWGRGARPVIEVNWHEAEAYSNWMSEQTGQRYRLPSEAEWEFAARAGSVSRYPWGNRASHDHANYGADQCCDGLVSGNDRWLNTAPVGSFPPNYWGIHDMHGNVYEWVEDCYVDSYRGAPSDGSARVIEECTYRVLRGGSWDIYPLLLRSADRFWLYPKDRNNYVGFRLVREMDEPALP